MTLLVTYDEAILRPGFENADEDSLTAVLQDVTDLARQTADGLLDDVQSPLTGALGPVRVVVIAAARRGWSNPRGLSQEQLGDYGYTSGGAAVASIFLTEREKKIVRRAAGAYGATVANLGTLLPLDDDRVGSSDVLPLGD